MVRSLNKKIKKSSHPLKNDLEKCLGILVDDTGDELHESQEWVDTVNRGGLTNVNNLTFELFVGMEKALRTILSTNHQISKVPTKCQQKMRMSSLHGALSPQIGQRPAQQLC